MDFKYFGNGIATQQEQFQATADGLEQQKWQIICNSVEAARIYWYTDHTEMCVTLPQHLFEMST